MSAAAQTAPASEEAIQVERRRVPELDGIRGAAIMMVLVFHYVACTVPEGATGLMKALQVGPRLLWTGVDLFFVLSGFLIGGILLDAKNSPNYFKTFYMRRFHRILPLYFVWITLFFIGARFSSGPLFDVIFRGNVPEWSYAFFFQNLFTWKTLSYGPAWVSMTWSLAVEEQFYLLLPMAIRFLSARSFVILTAACVVAAPLLRTVLLITGVDGVQIHPTLPCRADALGLGVLSACALRNEHCTAWLRSHSRVLYGVFGAGVVGAAYLWRWPSAWAQITFGYTVMAILYTSLLLIAVIDQRSPLTRIVRHPILVKLGNISYGLYIVHTGALFLAFAIIGAPPFVTSVGTALLAAATLAAVLGIAELSWRYFELPIVRRGQRLYRY